MAITALGWLLGSSLGRKVALYGLIAAAVLFVVLRIFAAGKASERAKQQQEALKRLRERMKIDDEVTQLSAPERRERLRKWVRDE